MALVNVRDILPRAAASGYAVGAFNVVSLDFVESVLAAACAKRAPVILSVAELHFGFMDLETLAPVIRRAAERAPVPVALALDHGMSLPTIMRAIRAGFTSVMCDFSSLPFEENVRSTVEAAKLAHSVDVTVEAELGRVLGAEGDGAGDDDASHFYTDPEQAAEFVRRTGVDALAVAIGTQHGVYVRSPQLDFPRLERIRQLVGDRAALVLHGGSGTPTDQFQRAVQLGISKINIYTDMSVQATQRIRTVLREQPDIISLPDIMIEAKDAIRRVVEEKMDIFGCTGVCRETNPLCGSCNSDSCMCGGKHQHDGRSDEELIRLVTRVTMSLVESMRGGV